MSCLCMSSVRSLLQPDIKLNDPDLLLTRDRQTTPETNQRLDLATLDLFFSLLNEQIQTQALMHQTIFTHLIQHASLLKPMLPGLEIVHRELRLHHQCLSLARSCSNSASVFFRRTLTKLRDTAPSCFLHK